MYKNGELEYMVDGKYKYIIDLDNNELDIYITDINTDEENIIANYKLDKVKESDINELNKMLSEKNEEENKITILEDSLTEEEWREFE